VHIDVGMTVLGRFVDLECWNYVWIYSEPLLAYEGQCSERYMFVT
jgi:hypothetical protein